MNRWRPERSWPDHMLVCVGCVLATFAAGMSIGKTETAVFLAVATIATALIGYALANLLADTVVVGVDGWLWAAFGLFCFVEAPNLNRALPGGGFPFELMVAGGLSWMIILGMLVSWRDSTLLFLTLPCMAIFGLVGTFDTYPPATLMFFVFMTCSAVLYARIHQRNMIERAREAGVKEPARLRRDSWRWVAGPEWALASAGVVILISLMGAPLVRLTVAPVSKNVLVRLPSPGAATQRVQPGARVDVRVGNGPMWRISDTPVFKVKLERGGLLRESFYYRFANNGWISPPMWEQNLSMVVPAHGPRRASGPHGGIATQFVGFAQDEPLQGGESSRVELQPLLQPQALVLAPGQVTEVLGGGHTVSSLADGRVFVDPRVPLGGRFVAYALLPKRPQSTTRSSLPPSCSVHVRTESMELQGTPHRVIEFARDAIRGVDGDFARARAIEEAISAQAKYNLKARPVPSDANAVDSFLFDIKEGYCDLFATSMVMCSRAVGLPARYVQGYLVSDLAPDAQGFRTVRERDYHAWAEIYFEGCGWVAFDPTQGAERVDAAAENSDAGKPWYQQEWFRHAVDAALGVCAGLVVLLLVAPKLGGTLWSRLLAELDVRSGRTTRDEVARLHGRFLLAVERRAKFPRRFSHTTREYIDLAARSLGAEADAAKGLVAEFDAAFFAPAAPSPEKVATLATQVGRFATALRKEARSQA